MKSTKITDNCYIMYYPKGEYSAKDIQECFNTCRATLYPATVIALPDDIDVKVEDLEETIQMLQNRLDELKKM